MVEVDREALLQAVADIPTFAGGSVRAVSDCSDGFVQLTVENTTDEMLDAYCKRLEQSGFVKYDENEIVGNRFYTYTKGARRVYVYRTLDSNEVRIVAGFDCPLPSLQKPAYVKICDESLALIKVGEKGGGLGVIIRLEDGSFVIFDGGLYMAVIGREVYDTLLKMAIDPTRIVIRAWFLTHAHGDHFGGLVMFLKNHYDKTRFCIEQFVMNFCDTDEQKECVTEPEAFDLVRNFIATYAPEATVYKAFTGQRFYLQGAWVEVLMCMSDFLPRVIGYEREDADKKRGDGNLQSMVFRIHLQSTSVMVTGDASKINVDEMCARFGSYLKTEYVTVVHHGHNENRYRARNGTLEFYRLSNPRVLLWPDSEIDQRKKLYWDGTPGGNYEVNFHMLNCMHAEELYVAGNETKMIPLPKR